MPSIYQASFDMSSMPMTESRFDLSMSAPITESRFDMSMSTPITLSDFDSSMSLMMTELPQEAIAIDPFSSDEEGNTVVLASFLAGIGVFVIAAAAMFMKMRRVRARQAEESRESNDENAQVESFATFDDMEDPEDGLHSVRIN